MSLAARRGSGLSLVDAVIPPRSRIAFPEGLPTQVWARSPRRARSERAVKRRHPARIRELSRGARQRRRAARNSTGIGTTEPLPRRHVSTRSSPSSSRRPVCGTPAKIYLVTGESDQVLIGHALSGGSELVHEAVGRHVTFGRAYGAAPLVLLDARREAAHRSRPV